MRRLFLLALPLALTACGARSELPGDTSLYVDSDCSAPRIGLLGNPGAYDGGAFEVWLKNGGAHVERALTLAEQPLDADTLKPFDVVVLDWLTRDYTESEAAVLADWISAGGGAISLTGYDNNLTDDWHANSLLAPLQVGYSGELISEGPVTDFAAHPITQGLSSVVFKGGYSVSDLGGTASTRTRIAFLPTATDKTTVGYAVEMGSGRAFVWGDEWVEFLSTEDANFNPTFWVQAFDWTAPETCRLTPTE
ncbi:MAG: hypothetical protein U0441_19715 [Polyangiaceae bacterium]